MLNYRSAKRIGRPSRRASCDGSPLYGLSPTSAAHPPEETPVHQPCQSGGLVAGQSAFRNAGKTERHARLRALLQLDLATVQHDLKFPANDRIKEDFAFKDVFGVSLK